jgi:hypothetical protein
MDSLILYTTHGPHSHSYPKERLNKTLQRIEPPLWIRQTAWAGAQDGLTLFPMPRHPLKPRHGLPVALFRV